jgi:ATP-binding cassette, subfamily C, bacterial exporter for protease/lipase
MTSELGQTLSRFRGAFVALGLFSLVINLLGLVPSLYMLQIYDRVLASRNLGTLWAISGIALGLIVLLAAMEAMRSFVLVRAGNRLDHSLNQRVFGANFNQLARDGGGNSVQALLDFTQVRQFLTGPAAAYFDVPWAPIYLVACFLLHPMLGLVALMGLMLSVALGYVSSRLTEPVLSQAQQSAMQANGFASNQLRNTDVIAAMGMLGHIREHWHRLHHRMLAQQSQASDRAALLTAVSKNFRIAMQSVILGVGAYLVIEGTATPGTMIAASILMGKALGPIDQLVGSWKQVVLTRDAWARLNKLLDANPAQPAALVLPAPKGYLKVEGLLAAPPGRPGLVLRGVSFAVDPGEIVGVVGPSASGKSTLARVLVGVWPAAGGSVRLDSADVFTWNKEELGPHRGYLPQDVALFDGTVAENIARFGPLNAQTIVQAGQAADVHDMILRLPQGYETRIGVGGSALSGGQRQRLALARALYGEPALLVLDEPNASLDDAGEAALIRALEAFRSKGKTVVVIAHKLSILAMADKILVLNEGTVAAYGPRDQVMQMRSQVPVQLAAVSATAGGAA